MHESLEGRFINRHFKIKEEDDVLGKGGAALQKRPKATLHNTEWG